MAIRTTGTLVINGKRSRRKNTAKKRRTVKRNAHGRARSHKTKTRRRNPRKSIYGSKGRWGNKAYLKRHNAKRRHVKRKNASHKRRATRRNPRLFRAFRRPLARRRTFLRRRPAFRVLKNSHKRRHARRRNPGMLSGVQGYARKLPIVGGFFSEMIGLIGPAAFGALGVEPVMQGAKLLAPYVPELPASIFYPAAGLAIAAAVQKFLPVDKNLRDKLAVGIAAATGAIGYYKWRTDTDSDMAGELGALEGFGALEVMAGDGYGDMGDGFATTVVPYGALEVTQSYSDAAVDDVDYAPDDLDYGELQVALSGAYAWADAFGAHRRRRKKKGGKGGKHGGKQHGGGGPSDHAGEHGNRWGWLIRWIGFENFQKLAALPTDQRQQMIAQLKAQAKGYATQLLTQGMQQQAPADTSGWAGAGWGSAFHGVYGR